MALGEGEDIIYLTGVPTVWTAGSTGASLYLRVVDIQDGKENLFSLRCVVWHGLQMLLYLFSLEKNGETAMVIRSCPAGVLYVPARDTLLSSRKT